MDHYDLMGFCPLPLSLPIVTHYRIYLVSKPKWYQSLQYCKDCHRVVTALEINSFLSNPERLIFFYFRSFFRMGLARVVGNKYRFDFLVETVSPDRVGEHQATRSGNLPSNLVTRKKEKVVQKQIRIVCEFLFSM